MKKLLITLQLILPFIVNGGTLYENYSWNTFSDINRGDSVKTVNGAAVTLERHIKEVYLNNQNFFEEIGVSHKKIKVESHDALNKFNKIYIPMSGVIEILNLQARFISKTGKITELTKENIKKMENLENKGNYTSFVIEGAEVGGQIEYFYVLRKKFESYGGYYLQDETPKANVEVIFDYPNRLSYLIKGYNGVPTFTLNDSIKERERQSILIKYIPEQNEERYASNKANQWRYEFTLSYNRYISSLRTYSWSKGCSNIYNNIYALTSSSDISATTKLLSQMEIEKETNPEAKIRKIENWVKTNITISDDVENDGTLAKIIKMKQADKLGAKKLLSALYKLAQIEFEIVETGDTEDRPFDPDYNGINYFVNILYYFPQIDKYLSPDNSSYRLGLIPDEMQGQYAIFASPLKYNESLATLGYCIKKIPLQACTTNSDSLLIHTSIDTENNSLNISVHREIKGAMARTFQSLIHLLTNEKKTEMISTFFSMGDQKTEIKSYNVQNELPENIGFKPIIWDLNLASNTLVEKAGKDIIVHLGETIGKQTELYQEKSRKQPISFPVLHKYVRKITFDIPEGYQVANPQNMNIKVEMKKDGKPSCDFWSKAEIAGKQLIVNSGENYFDNYYPVERYEEFRAVINASADFNKRTIVLKKL